MLTTNDTVELKTISLPLRQNYDRPRAFIFFCFFMVWLPLLAAPGAVKAPAQKLAAAKSAPRRANEKPRAVPRETLLRIIRAEDELRWDEADLGALLADAQASVRQRAALAAGRIGDEGALAPLSSLLLKDTSESVRAMAAFALGEVEQLAGAEALLEALRTSKSTAVRARALEALGKIAAALPEKHAEQKKELGEAILLALSVEQKLRKPDRSVVLLGLTATLRARPADASRTVALFLSSTDPRVRADALNTLARLQAKDVNGSVRPLLLNDTDPVVRAHAARALSAALDAASFDVLLTRSLHDPHEHVRISATRALASLKDARAAAPLLGRAEMLLSAYRAAKIKGTAHPAELNELLEIATALGRMLTSSNDERAVAFLNTLRDTVELKAPEVEIAFARVAPAHYIRAQNPFGKMDCLPATSGVTQPPCWQNPQSVSSVAQGLGEIAAITSVAGGNSAVILQADAQMLVRALLLDAKTPALAMRDVLRALAAFKPPDQGEVMRAKLTEPDVMVRATAAELLSELAPDPRHIRALADALPKALEDKLNDAALAILDALAKQKGHEALEALKSVLGAPDYLVRRRAAALLRKSEGLEAQTRVEPVTTRHTLIDYQRASERIGKRLYAVVITDKGEVVIELLPGEAPLTVDNFVQLARRNFFDNLTFHRVVPNFVIQGGDPRGDGSGGPGYQIRCEINQAPYARGAVGMAHSGKDTGGSQWFITHSPQPHLDGGYTVFGQVVRGLEIVDKIVRGDRIRSIQMVEGKLPAAKKR